MNVQVWHRVIVEMDGWESGDGLARVFLARDVVDEWDDGCTEEGTDYSDVLALVSWDYDEPKNIDTALVGSGYRVTGGWSYKSCNASGVRRFEAEVAR